jgi:hypothetical protein
MEENQIFDLVLVRYGHVLFNFGQFFLNVVVFLEIFCIDVKGGTDRECGLVRVYSTCCLDSLEDLVVLPGRCLRGAGGRSQRFLHHSMRHKGEHRFTGLFTVVHQALSSQASSS